jgi:hypothetical protein
MFVLFFLPNTMNKINQAILYSSIIIFGISLFQNCFCTNGCISSFVAVLFGFLGITTGGIANLCWVANPLLYMSWMTFYKDTKSSLIYSLLASVISFMFIFATRVAVDEGGSPRRIQSLEIGYWLWLSSILIISIGNGVRYYLEHSKNKNLNKDS